MSPAPMDQRELSSILRQALDVGRGALDEPDRQAHLYLSRHAVPLSPWCCPPTRRSRSEAAHEKRTKTHSPSCHGMAVRLNTRT